MKKIKRMQKIVVAVLAFVLALLMLAPILSMIAGSAKAVSESDLRAQINQLQNSASELEGKMDGLSSQLSAIKNDKSKALAAKELLDNQMANIEAELSNIVALIALYDELITEEEANLAAAREKEALQYQLFCGRVRAMEETGTVSYWAIIFNASDFSDLLDRATLVSEVMEYDNAVMELLAAARQAIADTKAELEGVQAEQEAAKAEQEVAQAAMEAKVSEAAALVTAIKTEEQEYAEALAELKAEEDRIDGLIAKRQKELEEKIRLNQIQFDAGSGYYYPLPSSYTKISSRFGYRIHPITKRPQTHNGIDLPAPRNTNIYAVRGGVVSISGYSSSYGNYVVIQHDNGVSTLYAHMNSRAVKVDAIVKQGQVIGYVGTTGSSTGNHLHFEIRESGTRVNPVTYYPSISFTYSD